MSEQKISRKTAFFLTVGTFFALGGTMLLFFDSYRLHKIVVPVCISVTDMLFGGAPDAVLTVVSQYAMPCLVAVLCALIYGLQWTFHRQEKPVYRVMRSGTLVFGMTLIALITHMVDYAIGAAIGGIFCGVGIAVYAWLKKACPKVFNREVVSYVVFGALTTVVSFVTQMLFSSLGTDVMISTVGSWVCAVAFAYVVNKLFVFESHTDTASAFWRELGLFIAARLASLALEMVFMFVTVKCLHLPEAACKLAAQVFIIIANYIFSKLFIFRKKPEE